MALTPAEQAELDELEKTYGAATAPEQAPAPEQAVADSLPTTNEADAWLRKPANPAPDGGMVTVYEPPLNVVQKALAENPERAAALLPEQYSRETGLPLSQQEIAELNTDSPLYQAYANDLFEQYAKEGTAKGKTVYRYSRAPTLQGGAAGLNPLQTLGMKAEGAVLPAIGAADAVILGVDNGMTLGLAGRAHEAQPQTMTMPGAAQTSAGVSLPPLGPLSDANLGPPAVDPNEIANPPDMSRAGVLAEHPTAAMIGQGVGTMGPGAANAIFKGASGLTSGLAGATPGFVRSAAVSGLAGALGGGAESVARDAVGAGMNALQGGTAPHMEPGWDDRAKVAAALGGIFGTGLDLAGSAAQGTAKYISGPTGRFNGLPDEFRQAGGTFTTGGPKPPAELEPLIERSRASGIKPVDTKALELKPHIQDSVKKNVSDVATGVGETERAFFPTREGQMLLPNTKVVEKALETLREQHADGRVIGAGHSAAKWTRDIFNNEISGVSTQPIKGGIEMSVDEAEAFLGPTWRKELLAKTGPKGPKPTSSGAREIDLEAPSAPEGAEPFGNTLRRRGVSKIYVAPQRYNAEKHQQLIETFQKLRETDDPAARDAQSLWIAALKDRDARPMNGEESGWSKHMQGNAARIGAAKDERDLAAPDGNAFQPLVDYSKQRTGQAELSNALRGAADRGGKRAELEQMRVLGMLDQMQQLSNLGGGAKGSTSVPWMPGRLVNAASLRGLSTLEKAGNIATSPLRGGRGGVAGSVANIVPPFHQGMLNLIGTSLDDKKDKTP